MGLWALIGVVAPVFLLIGLGFAMGKAGVFSPEQLRGFGRFVLLVALPALVFNALSKAQLAQILRVDYLLVYALASLGSFAAGYLWFRKVAGLDGAKCAVRAMGMSCSNTAFIGFPVATQLFGAAAAGPLALNMLVENLVMMPLMLVLIEMGQKARSHPLVMARNIAAGLLRSPLMLAIVLGAGFAGLGLRLPEPVAKTVGMLGNASGALALITIGASLAGVGLAGQRGAIAAIAAGKLLVHPALALGLLLVVPVGDPLFRSGLLLSAALPMVTIFPVMAQRSDDAPTCSAALLVTTLAGFGSILAMLGWLGI